MAILGIGLCKAMLGNALSCTDAHQASTIMESLLLEQRYRTGIWTAWLCSFSGEDLIHAQDVLQRVGLSESADCRVETLSDMQRSRLAVACKLLQSVA